MVEPRALSGGASTIDSLPWTPLFSYSPSSLPTALRPGTRRPPSLRSVRAVLCKWRAGQPRGGCRSAIHGGRPTRALWPRGDPVRTLTDRERQLLEGLAQAGQPTELRAEDLMLGKTLESSGLLCFVRDTARAVITPKGRHALFHPEPGPQPHEAAAGLPWLTCSPARRCHFRSSL